MHRIVEYCTCIFGIAFVFLKAVAIPCVISHVSSLNIGLRNFHPLRDHPLFSSSLAVELQVVDVVVASDGDKWAGTSLKFRTIYFYFF